MASFVAEKNARLDMALVTGLKLHSRREAQRLIDAEAVSVEGRKVTKASSRVKEGEKITVQENALEEKRASALMPVDIDLPILYEDDACFVLAKPAGFSVHPAPGIPKEAPTILHGIAHLFKKRKLPFSEDGVLVHRLDKDTTGCLLVAKTPRAHTFLQRQFHDRTIGKQYLALVVGVPSPAAAIIDAPIGRHSGDRTKMAVFHSVAHTREAKTTYRTLGISKKKDASLLLLDLHTGRTHQVRVHLKSIGHPVLGDTGYATDGSKDVAADADIDTLCLHAWKLTFQSPSDAKDHTVVAPLPLSFKDALRAVSIGLPKP